MNRNRVTVFCMLAILFGEIPPLMAQDSTRMMPLQEAIDLSVRNSKQLKSSQAKIEEATGALKEAIQRRLPDASVGGSYLQLTKPDVSLKVKNNSGSGGGGNSGGLNLSNINISQVMYGSLNVSLPLYTGLRINAGIESAQFLEQAAKLDADYDRDAVIQNTIGAFTSLFKAKEALGLVMANLEEARQRVTDFTHLEKNGLLARNDLLKAELVSSNLELSQMDAENNLKLARISIDLLMGLPENTVIIPDSSSLQQTITLKTMSEYEQAALQNRKDIQALAYRVKSAGAAIKSAKSEYYPSLALTGGYIALYVPNFISVTNAFTIGAGLKYNIGSLWKTDAKVQQAKAREKQVEANEEMLDDNIRLEVSQAFENYLSSLKKIDVYAKAIDQASENYTISKNKFDNSLLTTTDLLDADLASLQAKLSFLNARVDALVAYDRLLQVSGLLAGPSDKK